MKRYPDAGFDFDDDDTSHSLPKDDKSGKMPPRVFTDLASVNLDKELTDQFAEATSYRDWVLLNAESMMPNHVTDTIKTVNTLISQIIKMRETVQNMQRMMKLEDAVIETMKEFPEKVRTSFFDKLAESLK